MLFLICKHEVYVDTRIHSVCVAVRRQLCGDCSHFHLYVSSGIRMQGSHSKILAPLSHLISPDTQFFDLQNGIMSQVCGKAHIFSLSMYPGVV